LPRWPLPGRMTRPGGQACLGPRARRVCLGHRVYLGLRIRPSRLT